MFPENCYVLWDETREAVVIDPGCFYEEEKQALKGFITSFQLNIKHLLNTHLHLDHIFGNPFMLKEFGLKVSNLYISQIKRKCGIEVGENYNLPKTENPKVPQCPKEKEDAIKAALKYFAMI